MAEADDRQAAINRLKARRGFRVHLLVYVGVNAMLVAIWFANGAGPFWPIWPIAGWGIGIVAHAWGLYFNKPISEDAIRREMEKGG